MKLSQNYELRKISLFFYQLLTIIKYCNGKVFVKVDDNFYSGNGGGGHPVKGAKIPKAC
jgi:hypothetical protein